MNQTVDAVFAYRDWSKVPYRHRATNMVFKGLFNFLFKTNIYDLTNGMASYSKNAIEILNRESDEIRIKPDGFEIEVFIKWALIVKNRLRCIQTGPCKVRYNKKSNPFHGIKMSWTLLRYMIYLRLIS